MRGGWNRGEAWCGAEFIEPPGDHNRSIRRECDATNLRGEGTGKVQGRFREGDPSDESATQRTRPSRGIFRSVAPVATSNTVT